MVAFCKVSFFTDKIMICYTYTVARKGSAYWKREEKYSKAQPTRENAAPGRASGGVSGNPAGVCQHTLIHNRNAGRSENGHGKPVPYDRGYL